MILGAISPKNQGDKRTTLHPESIKPLLDIGIEVIFESGLGLGIDISDKDMAQLGANEASREECLRKSDLLFSSTSIPNEEINLLKKGSIFLGLLDPFSNKEQFHHFLQNDITAISMEFIPRITRAQKMDVLSSQSNLGGYVAVIESAKNLNSALPMMMTAAGTLRPAAVFVIGVGVAGLQAIATAKRLGAKVEAFDTRPVVEEQVKSLGAKFVKIDLGDTGQTDQGYAKELTEEQIKKQKEVQSDVCAKSDIVITTAQIFGKPAPKIIDIDTIKRMKPGSVIFDMAVESGGNVEGSRRDSIEIIDGVKIIGYSNLPSFVANHASFALSNNLVNFVTDFYDQENKSMNLDMEDEIIQSAVLVKDGKIKEGF
tara:strand:+ start:11400 stop:12512 length:1113 start_codon:yes stop_codon:yes gene_type:complete